MKYLSNCELINYQNVKKKDYFFTFLSTGSLSFSSSTPASTAGVAEALFFVFFGGVVDVDELVPQGEKNWCDGGRLLLVL